MESGIFLYQFIAFVYELYIMFVYSLLYSFLHAERDKILCEEEEIWCHSFSPEEPNVRYVHHVMWCAKRWTSDIEDCRLMAFLCSLHLDSCLLHIMSGI